ncbi:MAG: tryptophan halogenase [Alteromonadaceae bacterium]|nr:MAG: tryptophan halogenase [Alteromonadaceae bacterium]
MSEATPPISRIVIAGGGTAGWMCAAALARVCDKQTTQITLIESENIGSIGVGEATLPVLRDFNRMLGIDEQEFMKATNATFKLGIEFKNWARQGQSYFHPFSGFGLSQNLTPFHLQWLQAHHYTKNAQSKDITLPNFDEFAIVTHAARNNKFAAPGAGNQIDYTYAYHLDATAYAQYLRRYSEALGVVREEGKITHVALDSQCGNITALSLDNGKQVSGDLFIDCSGFRALLIGKVLDTAYIDWRHWLPCDRAVALQTERPPNQPLHSYTTSTAHRAGWQWHIPLQHRTGNGHVYCSKYVSDDEALSVLQSNSGKAINEPKVLHFGAGMRQQCWKRNCISIGLSSGFLEPLESTSIYLIQFGIFKLIELFPRKHNFEIEAKQYNRLMREEYESIRDFLIMHYALNQHKDLPFWADTANMPLPVSLQERLALFKSSGYLPKKRGSFGEASWLAVLYGQHCWPQFKQQGLALLEDDKLLADLQAQHQHMQKSTYTMPAHSSIFPQKPHS